MIFLIGSILYLTYIQIKFGIRNYFIFSHVKCYFILDGVFNKIQFIETLKSYNFNIINKFDNEIIVNYKSNNEIINFKIDEYNNNYKINIIFNHTFFDMQSIINIINNYLQNNITKKKMITYKHFYINDILMINLFYSSILNFNKKYSYKKIIISKDYIEDIRKKINNYVSKIDIIKSIITDIYLQKYKKKKCNMLLIKAEKNKQKDYFGNPLTTHLIQINKNSIEDMAYQIRNSYTNNNISLIIKIDIYITSWIPNENKINEININNEINLLSNIKINFFIILCIEKDNYVINLYYL